MVMCSFRQTAKRSVSNVVIPEGREGLSHYTPREKVVLAEEEAQRVSRYDMRCPVQAEFPIKNTNIV